MVYGPFRGVSGATFVAQRGSRGIRGRVQDGNERENTPMAYPGKWPSTRRAGNYFWHWLYLSTRMVEMREGEGFCGGVALVRCAKGSQG